ncbi:DNA cytosine methyltransferase [Microbacterium gorillae]|uniref:DNA cytosine methyltransferase n=1 Tax=Microbacterium gorillae TaxID=1231063 RepID=UPI003D9737D5
MERVIDLFAGPGGWDEGARLLDERLDITGVDYSRDACRTAITAGHRRQHQDVRDLSSAALEGYTGAIMSPPCPTFSRGGLRTGWADYQKVLDVWTGIGWGLPAAEAMSAVEDVQDPRTAMLAWAGATALTLAGLRWLVMEQVPKVEFAWEDLAAELFSAGWEWADVVRVNAEEHGLPSRRSRVFLVARRLTPGRPIELEDKQVNMAEALGWAGGHRINTRGARRSGGNEFSADRPSWCLTGSSRSWKREDGELLTPAEAGQLVGFRADYPWTGSRSSQFLQIANVVPPPIAAAVLRMVA